MLSKDLDKIKLTPLLDTLELKKISDAEYFSEKYSDYISNSKLSLINPDQGGSPELYFAGLNTKFSSSLTLGSAVHALILQPDEFYLCEKVDQPTGKAGEMAKILFHSSGKAPTDEEIISASNKVDYYKGKMNEAKISSLRGKCNKYWRDRAIFEHSYKEDKEIIYLDPKTREKAHLCVDSLNKNKRIQELLHPTTDIGEILSLNEQAILLEVIANVGKKEILLKLKSKLDNFTIDSLSNVVVLNDLKTTGHMTTEFKNSFVKYHYARQMGMYSWLLSLIAIKEYNIQSPVLKSNMLIVSTIPRYYSNVFPVTKQQLLAGFEEFKRLLKLVAYHTVYGY